MCSLPLFVLDRSYDNPQSSTGTVNGAKAPRRVPVSMLEVKPAPIRDVLSLPGTFDRKECGLF
jgi:hypothetical protein